MYHRKVASELAKRLAEPRRFIQIVLGPRQVGKTTLVGQALASTTGHIVKGSADDLSIIGRTWLIDTWNRARALAREGAACILAVDEVQKIEDWASVVKKLWDEDTASNTNVRVVLTGSSTMLIRKGMSESLAGRFEVMRASHWTWPEMQEAFGCTLNEYLAVGGYPGPMALRDDPDRWLSYMRESIIESTLGLDILSLERIDKPALLRNLFVLGTASSAQIISLQKLLGQLQDSGNAATISHYLTLLSDCGLLTGLEKYSATSTRSRAASPKLASTAPALVTSVLGLPLVATHLDPTLRGQIIESAVGAHLMSITKGTPSSVEYWREGNTEVDFVLNTPRGPVLLEVKSGDARRAYHGAEAFRRQHGKAPLIVVAPDATPLDAFLQMSLADVTAAI